MNEANTITSHTSGKLGKSLIYFFLSLWAITTIYPFIWVIQNSFKDGGLIRSDSFSIPIGDKFTFSNYIQAWNEFGIAGAYINSLIISCTVTIVVMFLAGIAAYGIARYNFRGKSAVRALVVASMMFPVFSTIIPVFRMMFGWNIVNTGDLGLSRLSVILPQIAGNLSFAIIVLIGFINSLPIDLEEAAYLEGYNVYKIFFHVIIPLAKPAFATVAIFTFLWSYNDLFTQLFFLRYKDTYTITCLLNEISSQAGVNYGLMSSSVVLVVVPVLIVYIVLQKNIIKGLTVGAIKG